MDTNTAVFRIGTWNIEGDKSRPGSVRGERVAAALAEPGCEVLCLTEGFAKICPAGGHVIQPAPDPDDPCRLEGFRRAILWSKQPWTDVDLIGSEQLPSGRFVAGVTQTSVGPLTVVGVCIPHDKSHELSGREDCWRWEEHKLWLAGFEKLPYRRATEKTVVLGDFNQRIPSQWVKRRAREVLARAFQGFLIPTSGDLPELPGRALDHIAHTPDMRLHDVLRFWSKRDPGGKPLSDHFGVRGDFLLSSANSETV